MGLYLRARANQHNMQARSSHGDFRSTDFITKVPSLRLHSRIFRKCSNSSFRQIQFRFVPIEANIVDVDSTGAILPLEDELEFFEV